MVTQKLFDIIKYAEFSLLINHFHLHEPTSFNATGSSRAKKYMIQGCSSAHFHLTPFKFYITLTQ